MRWKDALRNELNRQDAVADRQPLPREPQATEASHRALVRRAFLIGMTVLEEAHAELMLAGRRAMLECDVERNALRINDQWLEVTRQPNGLALEVRRRGFVEQLRVEGHQLLDGSARHIENAEAYFGELVVKLVTS